ncbi:MAG: NAD(P)H-dependent oxidoreductase [Pseudomonadota bacterium]
MLVLGLQSSPRKNGSTDYLLTAFFKEIEKYGVESRIVELCRKDIRFCKGCGYCEKHGVCITKDDDMALEMYSLVRDAEIVVAATPIYFYHASAQMKAFIDRCQTLWSRKYRFRLSDPGYAVRKGFLLSQAATKGTNLFEGLEVTMKYFFDALNAKYCGGLTYRSIEKPEDYRNVLSLPDDIANQVKKLLSPLINRKKILFACRENACRSQVASAFAQYYGGEKVEALRGGSLPAERINPMMEEVMAEKGLDMAFRIPQSMEKAIAGAKPDIIVTMGCGEACPFVPGAQRVEWDLPDPAGRDLNFMREVRDRIEDKILELLGTIQT